MSLPPRHQHHLQKRIENNSLRSLTTVNKLIDFSSNDYLGLSRNKALWQIIQDSKTTKSNGSTGSRLLTGNSDCAIAVERFLALQFQSQATLVFNSGYNANLSVLSTLPLRNDVIYYDELSHASIKDGIRLSLAKKASFKHNDLVDLEKKLKAQTEGDTYVVVESVYSMDGDICDLQALVQISKRHKAYLIVDEAHATGLMGINGGGLSETLGLQNDIFCRIYTFGKAMGIHGAAIAGSNELIQYLINFARPFIYTTAPPDHHYAAIKCAFEFLNQHPELKEKAQLQTKYFTQQANSILGNKYKRTNSNHPIQTILIEGNDEVRQLAKHLQYKGFDVKPILSPTVKEGQERLRICIHSFNTNDEITALIDTLAAYS
ncbi:MAG TPA: 8-amino-7-oxononanoate synthase [Fulvivirga sp.]|nr:8-amino-7-oxononanoate synthase [Fulvivirga sp.]